ncbi:VOC family protein [Streptomyces murinus]|uniref:VOC family protein n=1 Tax=Streptomyces murinus TaxID=33900 RepID=UPI00381EC3DC
MAADGFASLVREDTPDVILLRRGTEVLPEGFRDQPAAGVIIAFTVDDLDAEYERLKNEGAPVTMPLREEPWGERLFQIHRPQRRRHPARRLGHPRTRVTQRQNPLRREAPEGVLDEMGVR